MEKQSPRNSKTRRSRSDKKQRQKQAAKPSNKSVPGNLQQKLFRLLAGDKKTADRLINGLRLKHPGEQEQWYLEKAIFDLERDRR